MHCMNLNDVMDWWNMLQQKNVAIRRYQDADLHQLDSTDHMTIFKDNLDEWLAGEGHATFWHLKQLIINLREQEVKIPVVATRLDENLFVDPGGSRIAVLKYIGKKSVAVDVVYPTQFIDEIALGDYVTIGSVQQLIEPYEKIGLDYKMDVCYDKPCKTCENNNVIHNGAYRYSISWSRPWFYRENYNDWYQKNKDRQPANLLDWYEQ